MKHLLSKNQRGIGHLSLIIATAAVLAVGGVGWWIYNKNQDKKEGGSQLVGDAIKNAKCDYDDKDLCKFLTGWKAQDTYSVESVSKVDGVETKTAMKVAGENKYYLKFEGESPYEVIGIGDVTYTRTTDGTWWKQAVPKEDMDMYKANTEIEFTEPNQEGSKTSYKNLGKEACGDHTCFKYQMINDDDTATTTYLWFDDKDYQLRRSQATSEGSTHDSTFNYEKVEINEPSPVKELGPDEYLVPGQSAPATLPGAGDLPGEDEHPDDADYPQ